MAILLKLWARRGFALAARTSFFNCRKHRPGLTSLDLAKERKWRERTSGQPSGGRRWKVLRVVPGAQRRDARSRPRRISDAAWPIRLRKDDFPHDSGRV